MRNIALVVLVACLSFLIDPTCQAAPTAEAWRTIADSDSKAALSLVEDNHPGAAPELGDAAFQSRLATAKAHVSSRLPRVVDYASYSALMAGLAADFQDGHIWSNSIVGAQRVNVAGIILVRQAGHWLVGAQNRMSGEPDLKNSVLEGCDGQDADAWAFPRIAEFRGDPTLEAVRADAATWLLLDDGNPFLLRPNHCRFRTPGSVSLDVPLHWRPALLNNVRTAAKDAAKPGDAGMKVEPFEAGWWIGLDTLDDSAQKAVDLVRANLSALRAAPLVVLDLRGNGGGDSRYADAIARLLVGDKRFTASQVALPACSGDYWRVSPGALASVEIDLKQAEADNDLPAKDYDQKTIVDMRKAEASHRKFSPALPSCVQKTAAADQDAVSSSLPPSESKGHLIIVTDHACFSSCLIATNTFRRLGAVQVGEATDRSTRYMEVREETLPSGLRAFSTLQKVSVGVSDYGPYAPAITYPGSLGDDKALKSWVASLPPKS